VTGVEAIQNEYFCEKATGYTSQQPASPVGATFVFSIERSDLVLLDRTARPGAG
jgi:hypothetical protein